MPQLLDVLMLGRCSHEFSWPRRAADGHYYQVCLICATQYKYDWKTMRRTERMDPAVDTTTVRRGHTRTEKKPTWVPRARRLRVELPVRYRGKNLNNWFAGSIDNISQSGVLFKGEHALPANTLVEMIFEMPEEISGQKDSNVLCQGRVIQAREPRGKNPGMELAVSILDYKFLHKQ